MLRNLPTFKVKNIFLHKLPFIQKAFLDELELFSFKNTILGKDEHGDYMANVCLQCLKAFALQKADSLGYSAMEKEEIDNLFECDTGHDGYYLDCGELKCCYFD
jgi:hypothetical protein